MDTKITVLCVTLLAAQIRGQCPSETGGNPTSTSGGTCYIYISERNSWEDADSVCESQYGGASVQTQDANTVTVLTNFMAGLGVDTVWTGARALYTDWLWINGSAATASHTNWASPDHIYYTQGISCAAISVEENNKWRPFRCQLENYYICELDASSPNCVATDVRRVVIQDERCYSTDSSSLLTWTEARVACQTLGGDLAQVTSPQIEQAIQSIMDTGVSWHKYWIGLRQDAYYWSTGNPVTSFFWNDIQKGTEGACVTLYRGNEGMQWFAEKCDEKLPLICQIDSDTSTRIPVSTQLPPTTTVAPTEPPTEPRTTVTRKQTEATDPPATEPVVTVTAQSKGPSASVTAGLAVMVVIVFLILIGLVIFFLYYKRRNTLMKKAARAEATRLEAENGGGRVNFDHPDISEEEAGPSHRSSLFTTSQTTSEQNSSGGGGGKHTKYKSHHREQKNNEKALPKPNSQSSLVDSNGVYINNKHTPNHTPRAQEELNMSKKMNQSRVSLKSDSEGGTSETDDGMRRGGVRNSRSSGDVDNARSSKRRNIGVRRSNSRVRPADVASPTTTDSEGPASPTPKPQHVSRADSLRGSLRKGGNQLPPLEKQISQEDAVVSMEQPTGGKKKKHRTHRQNREGEEIDADERRHRRHRREGGDPTAEDRHNGQDAAVDFSTDRYNGSKDPTESSLPNHNGDIYENRATDGPATDRSDVTNEHRGRGHAKRTRKKTPSKYTLESNSNSEQFYMKTNGHDMGTYKGGDSIYTEGQNGYYKQPNSGRNRKRRDKYSTEEDHEDIESSLALQTVNTLDIDCVSDVEVDSLPDDENPVTLDSFV